MHIFATFFVSESQKRVGGRLQTVPCFSAKVEKYSDLRRFSYPFWGVEKTLGIRIVILIYINIYKYIYLYIIQVLSQPKAFGPANCLLVETDVVHLV